MKHSETKLYVTKSISRITFLLITLFPCYHAVGQTLHHIVEKGEDIQSIAKLYGTTCSKLAEMNNDIDVFYAGLAVEIPVPEDINIYELRKNKEQVLQYYAEYKQLKDRYPFGINSKKQERLFRI